MQVGGRVPYQAAPEAGLQAQPVAGLVVPQRAQEEWGGDAGVGGQRDGEPQGVDQRGVPGTGRTAPPPLLHGHVFLRGRKVEKCV